MSKRHLTALILRTRGGHALPEVTKMVESMTEEQARQWHVLLTNLQSDAESDGARKGARQPWRRF